MRLFFSLRDFVDWDGNKYSKGQVIFCKLKELPVAADGPDEEVWGVVDLQIRNKK